MSNILEVLQHWRNEDQADSIQLTRHEVITLLTEIERLRAALEQIRNDLVNWRDAAERNAREINRLERKR